MTPYRVVIGDDHEHARQAMRLILARDSSFLIVAEACDGEEVIRQVEQEQPDLVLMDINMPYCNGLQATRLIKERYPSTKIVMVTVSDDAAHLFEAIKHGAQGYLLKNLQPQLWLDYLHSLLGNEAPVPQPIARRVLHEFTKEDKQDSNEVLTSLTPREQEILTWVAKGWSNKALADQLGISEHTVKNHLKNIMQKLQVKNRVELTHYVYGKSDFKEREV
ncbi:response regulator transcription factor [Mechercharimyces sp. CAU 1602]|uniref:sigma-70 family RNA polymerase sigma factor n=1 Tax=Mechercharimyces sp. CAU 1602 TaxID=2973933 RepID=UPI002161E15F|nr:response regulator transcription factor [Mechercharimyces sp. CAU 1602]MCS1351029.1 response regulator transcription factor [Mechercharimyces sp. CAU 1602]